jgi:Winged helix-turn-helix transcription repressor, HrcA DNA-binding
MLEWNERRIPQQIGGWTVEMYWKEDEIQGGPLKLVVRPTDEKNIPAGGISSTVLREIDFRTGAAKAREQVAAEDLANAQTAKKPLPVAMPVLKGILDTGGITDVYLVLLAVEYIARVVRGEAKPVDHIAEELGKSLGTVKNHLWQARKRGLLKGGSAGRKGGFVPHEAAQIAIDWLEMNNALEDSDQG